MISTTTLPTACRPRSRFASKPSDRSRRRKSPVSVPGFFVRAHTATRDLVTIWQHKSERVDGGCEFGQHVHFPPQTGSTDGVEKRRTAGAGRLSWSIMGGNSSRKQSLRHAGGMSGQGTAGSRTGQGQVLSLPESSVRDASCVPVAAREASLRARIGAERHHAGSVTMSAEA